MRTVQRRGANHGLHAVLTLLTCGAWAVTGWPIAAAMGRRTVTDVRGFYSPQDGAEPGTPPAGPVGPQGVAPDRCVFCGLPIEWNAYSAQWAHAPGTGPVCPHPVPYRPPAWYR